MNAIDHRAHLSPEQRAAHEALDLAYRRADDERAIAPFLFRVANEHGIEDSVVWDAIDVFTGRRVAVMVGDNRKSETTAGCTCLHSNLTAHEGPCK